VSSGPDPNSALDIVEDEQSRLAVLSFHNQAEK